MKLRVHCAALPALRRSQHLQDAIVSVEGCEYGQRSTASRSASGKPTTKRRAILASFCASRGGVRAARR